MRPEIRIERLVDRLSRLAEFGLQQEGSVSRLALTPENGAARDLVVDWMEDLDLDVRIDGIGNVFGLRRGSEDLPPVMTGSHIDTVGKGGRYDGSYGVLAGLEVVEALNEAGVETRRPLCVSSFTNEEGVRFTPDMMGSLVHAGGLDLEAALAARDRDGTTVGEALDAIGYAGAETVGAIAATAFVELHIEQGPLLEERGVPIGVVENLTGISWQAIKIVGEANHAGTTPMAGRRDAGHAAARITTFISALAESHAPGQRATVGSLELDPNLVNVVPGRARLTVDLRNPDDAVLCHVEDELSRFLTTLESEEGFEIDTERLVRTEPVRFDPVIVDVIERVSDSLGVPSMRMTSGAGHDAQMMARVAPTAMIFVPSRGGISHSGAEHTDPEHLLAGARVLLGTILELAGAM